MTLPDREDAKGYEQDQVNGTEDKDQDEIPLARGLRQPKILAFSASNSASVNAPESLSAASWVSC